MIALRHEHPALVYGSFTLYDEKFSDVLTYFRTLEGDGEYFVELNLTPKRAKRTPVTKEYTLIATNVNSDKTQALTPFEANVYKVN